MRGRMYETGEQKMNAFVAHNLITDPAEERMRPAGQARRRPKRDVLVRVMQCLRRAKSNSSPGPDGKAGNC